MAIDEIAVQKKALSFAVAACGALLLAVFVQRGESGQTTTTGPTQPPLVISSMAGRDLFEFYCAPCHGRDGKGAGPAVPALKAAPPDLTTLARRNGGVFARARVAGLVTNDERPPLPAHGSREMPMWGPIFKGLDAHDTSNRIRIENIVRHIESLQTK